MGEETSDAMNFDLNLSPGLESVSRGRSNSDDTIDDPIQRLHELVRIRTQRNLRMGSGPEPPPTGGGISDDTIDDPLHSLEELVTISSHAPHRLRMRYPIPYERRNISMELNHVFSDSGNAGSILQTGEGSAAAEDRIINEVPKTCEHNNGILESGVCEKTNDFDKENGDKRSFFDCNICLDLSTDPVLTSCGHLFCWPCLYKWLNVFSDAKECPVCKGEVTEENITPIYGRGTNARNAEEDPSIPVRPDAKRVESLRQTMRRNFHSLPVEEVIRRIRNRFDSVRDLNEQPMSDSTIIRGHRPLLGRSEAGALNEERIQPIDDRDSLSSIVAVNSESQMDTVSEIDSIVTLLNSSRRRNAATRGSDIDSGDSRALRRRRLN